MTSADPAAPSDPTACPVPGLPARRGTQPGVIGPSPHAQVSQNAPAELQEQLFTRMRALPGVRVGDTLVSVPGARALHLAPELCPVTGSVEARN